MTRPGRRKRADSLYAEQALRLAEQLRSLRDRAGVSQEQLAAQAEVSVATVSKIETGVVREPGYFTVIAMLNALNAAIGERA
jgi:transcriptional regulator with XRE-family HTH domain